MQETTEVKVWNIEDPLARCELDTARSHAALLDYWQRGPGRSLPRLAEHYRTEYVKSTDKRPPTVHRRVLERWSSDGQWQERVAAQVDIERREWDDALLERRLRIAEENIKDADKLREIVRAALDEQAPNFLKRTVKRGRDGQTIVFVALDTGDLVSMERLSRDLARDACGTEERQDAPASVTVVIGIDTAKI